MAVCSAAFWFLPGSEGSTPTWNNTRRADHSPKGVRDILSGKAELLFLSVSILLYFRQHLSEKTAAFSDFIVEFSPNRWIWIQTPGLHIPKHMISNKKRLLFELPPPFLKDGLSVFIIILLFPKKQGIQKFQILFILFSEKLVFFTSWLLFKYCIYFQKCI